MEQDQVKAYKVTFRYECAKTYLFIERKILAYDASDAKIQANIMMDNSEKELEAILEAHDIKDKKQRLISIAPWQIHDYDMKMIVERK